MDLSLVIVNYNVRDLLRQCLRSVEWVCGETELTYEAWVIDNASTDQSAEMVTAEFPAMRLIHNERNVGFAAANNQGLAQAQGDYVMLLNPDTELRPGSVSEMMGFMAGQAQVGMVGPRLFYGDGSFQHAAFYFPSLWQILLDFYPLHHRLLNARLNGRYPQRWYEQAKPFPIDHPLGACMVVRREVLEAVGLLDERFFMYCEEIDWAMRIHKAGWDIYTVPTAHVIHYGGQSAKQFRDKMFIALWRSRFLLFDKHYSPLFQRSARWLVRFSLKQALARLAQEDPTDERASRQAAYRAVLEM